MGFISANSTLLTTIALNIVLGIGTYIPFKAGVYSFAGVGFLAIGAFGGLWMVRSLQVGLWEAVLLCAVLGFVLSAGLGWMVLSLRRLYLSVATLAFSLLVQALALIGPVTGGVQGITGIPQLTSGTVVAVVLLVIVLVLIAGERLPVARVMSAVREDEIASAVAGINPWKVRYWAFIAGGVLYVAFGPIWAHSQFYVTPTYFSFATSVQLLLYAAVGGQRSFWGTVLTAAVITSLPTLVGSSLGSAEPMVYGLILLVVIVVLPGGLSSLPSLVLRSYRRLRNATDPTRTSLIELPATLAPAAIDTAAIDTAAVGTAAIDAAAPCVSVTGLSRSFGGVAALDSVSLDIFPGQVLAIIGPNGAGKTTLINAITGMVTPSSGAVLAAGRPVTGWSTHRLARLGIVRTLQAPRLFSDLSYAENLILPDLGLRPWRVGRRQRVPGHGRHGDVGQLPYGDRRLLEIARALELRPFCLFLDEPSAGMTAAEVDQLAGTIGELSRLGCAVVLVEHNLRLVRSVADRVVVLASGEKIAEGDLDQVMQDHRVREAYLGESQATSAELDPAELDPEGSRP